MSTGKLVLGILAGVAVGAALGILFAPDKGSVTRKKIAQKGGELSEDLKEKLNEFLASITEKFEAEKEEMMMLAENGKHKADRVASKH